MIATGEIRKMVEDAVCFTHFLHLALGVPIDKSLPKRSANDCFVWLRNGDKDNPLYKFYRLVWDSYHSKLINMGIGI